MVSVPQLFGDWRIDPSALVVLVIAATTWGSLVRRHRGWARARSAAFVGALSLAVLATQSGIATHDTTSFTAHVLQHVLLGMAVPLLLALSAPLTLVLQAADPRTRALLRRWLRHPTTAVLAKPLVGFVVFGASVIALTFTPLLSLSVRNDVVHVAVHAHLLLTGMLFLWPLVGVDPVPGRPSHGARLLIALAAVPFHAFVGVALLGARAPVLDVYPSLDDQRRAAGLLWASGELLTLAVAAIVFHSWYRAEARVGARADRTLDRRVDPPSPSAADTDAGSALDSTGRDELLSRSARRTPQAPRSAR